MDSTLTAELRQRVQDCHPAVNLEASLEYRIAHQTAYQSRYAADQLLTIVERANGSAPSKTIREAAADATAEWTVRAIIVNALPFGGRNPWYGNHNTVEEEQIAIPQELRESAEYRQATFQGVADVDLASFYDRCIRVGGAYCQQEIAQARNKVQRGDADLITLLTYDRANRVAEVLEEIGLAKGGVQRQAEDTPTQKVEFYQAWVDNSLEWLQQETHSLNEALGKIERYQLLQTRFAFYKKPEIETVLSSTLKELLRLYTRGDIDQREFLQTLESEADLEAVAEATATTLTVPVLYRTLAMVTAGLFSYDVEGIFERALEVVEKYKKDTQLITINTTAGQSDFREVFYGNASRAVTNCLVRGDLPFQTAQEQRQALLTYVGLREKFDTASDSVLAGSIGREQVTLDEVFFSQAVTTIVQQGPTLENQERALQVVQFGLDFLYQRMIAAATQKQQTKFEEQAAALQRFRKNYAANPEEAGREVDAVVTQTRGRYFTLPFLEAVPAATDAEGLSLPN